MVGIAAPRPEQRDDAQGQRLCDSVAAAGSQNRRGRVRRLVPVALVEETAGLVGEDLESPRIKAALDAVFDSFTLVRLGTRVVVHADGCPGQVDVGATGLLDESPLLAEVQASF